MGNKKLTNPQTVNFDITDKCNFRCQTCDKWKTPPEGKELSLEEIRKILLNLKEWLQNYLVFFSGGEPLLRKDLTEILKLCWQQGIAKGIITNGSLINCYIAKKFSDADLRLVNISINSIDAKKQDEIRGTKNCLKKIRKAVKTLRRKKIQTVLNCVIDSNNINELDKIVYWAKEKECKILFQAYFNSTFAFHKNEKQQYTLEKDWFLNDFLLPRNKIEISKAINKLLELKKKGFPIANSEKQLNFFKDYFLNPEKSLPFSCQNGSKSFMLDPYGNMRLCFNFPSLGNLRQNSARTLWFSEKARKQREAIERCHFNCKILNCNF